MRLSAWFKSLTNLSSLHFLSLMVLLVIYQGGFNDKMWYYINLAYLIFKPNRAKIPVEIL